MKAETIANALGGRMAGHAWMARCPAHNDRLPSLSISKGRDGKPLIHCFAGCEQRDVIAALSSRGLWEAERGKGRRPPRTGSTQPPNEASSDGPKRREAALAIWQGSRPAEGTLVEAYLRSRGLRLPVPPTIRFYDGLTHRSGGRWPAMVALVTHGAGGAPVGIHRTFLARDGSGKAPVDPAKMMLGPCRGGVVRLAEPSAELMVGEGIETCLTAMQATGRPAWAALSTSGLRALDLPREVRDVIVLANGDDAGEMAAKKCAARWTLERRRVRVARPPQGLDFNDLAMGRAP